MFQAGQRGGPSLLGEGGQTRTVEGEGDDEHRLSGMISAGSYKIFSDDKEKLKCMVNDIIEELMDLDMEPKPESFWWTSTCKAEDEVTLKVWSMDKSWETPFVDVFDLLGYRFRMNGKVFMGPKGRCGKIHTSTGPGVRRWGPSVKVVSNVFIAGLNGSVNWP